MGYYRFIAYTDRLLSLFYYDPCVVSDSATSSSWSGKYITRLEGPLPDSLPREYIITREMETLQKVQWGNILSVLTMNLFVKSKYICFVTNR